MTALLATVADVGGVLSRDDENYAFLDTTIRFSSQELYCQHRGEAFTLFVSMAKHSRLCDYLAEDGGSVYEFNCFVEANVTYAIDDPKRVSVAERDKTLLIFREEMQSYLNGLSEAEVASDGFPAMLTDKSAELAKCLSTENMKLSPCQIYLVDVIGEAEKAS